MMSTTNFTPPMRQGVSASQVFIQPHLQVHTIFDYLCLQFPHINVQEWQQRFHDGLIYHQNGDVLNPDTPYTSLIQQKIYYYRFLAHEIEVPFEHNIIYENESLLVVDKPHFLTVSPSGQYVQQTLLVRLKKQFQLEELTPIHRLDRETAGLILFCKKAQYRAIYQQLFATRQVYKEYHAIAPYNPTLTLPHTLKLNLQKGEPFYTMQVIQGNANSETEIHLLEHQQQWAKYKLIPKTGKQHQLRVHLNYLGIPIRHDSFYPTIQHKAPDDFSQPLQLLAKKLQFIDPITQHHFKFESLQNLYLE